MASCQRELAPKLLQCFGSIQWRALLAAQMPASSYLYRPCACDATSLCLRIGEIPATRVNCGNRRIHVMLRREGLKDNVKRVKIDAWRTGLNEACPRSALQWAAPTRRIGPWQQALSCCHGKPNWRI
jgi:hypothetical protein